MKTISAVALLSLVVTVALTGTVLSVPLSEIDIGWFREKPLEPVWGKDPFVPKVHVTGVKGAPVTSGESFVLTAVLLGGERPAAILNGWVVQVGDTVLGHNITRITKKSVFIRGPSGTSEIPLKPLFSVEGQKP